ncbi:MAG: vitamin K epoxide reductase family protein, partial [Myxococcales bacterium]|nr:vitamin K epoxide reductase family protein [Myxococcales bacterium]
MVLNLEMRRRLSALLAAASFFVSCYQAYLHVRAYLAPSVDSFCKMGEKVDCDAVALSPFSIVLGIPVPLYGVFLFGFALFAIWRRRPYVLPLSLLLAIGSTALIAVQIFLIGALCLLCEVVH